MSLYTVHNSGTDYMQHLYNDEMIPLDLNVNLASERFCVLGFCVS